MTDKKELSESRKKDIMKILESNPYKAILILTNSTEFNEIFIPLMEKYILPKLDSDVIDSSVYCLMERSYNRWKKCFDFKDAEYLENMKQYLKTLNGGHYYSDDELKSFLNSLDLAFLAKLTRSQREDKEEK